MRSFRKTVAILAAVMLLAAMLAACGEKGPAVDPDRPWVDKEEIAYTSEGTFTLTTSNYNDTGEVALPASLTLAQWDNPEQPGYKFVQASLSVDVAGQADGWWIWASAFDKYSGTSFEFNNIGHTLDGEADAPRSVFDGGAIIPGGVDVLMWNEGALSADRASYTRTINVCVPSEYDGTVFQVGYASKALTEKDAEMDYAGKFYTVDQTPYYDNGHEYKYFAIGQGGAMEESSADAEETAEG